MSERRATIIIWVVSITIFLALVLTHFLRKEEPPCPPTYKCEPRAEWNDPDCDRCRSKL